MVARSPLQTVKVPILAHVKPMKKIPVWLPPNEISPLQSRRVLIRFI